MVCLVLAISISTKYLKASAKDARMVKYGMEIVALGTLHALTVTFTTISFTNAKRKVLTAGQNQTGMVLCVFALLAII